MTYFDQKRSKKSAIKEGVTDVFDIVDEQQSEAATLAQMREQSELEDTATMRHLICDGRCVDSPDMMTLEEYNDALDAIGVTSGERRGCDHRILLSGDLAANDGLDDESDQWVRDVDHVSSRMRLSAPRPISLQPNFHLGSFY